VTDQTELLGEIRRITGRDIVLAVPRSFITLTGEPHAALLLSQLLYWTPRATLPGGWVYKSRAEWFAEIGGTRYALDCARRRLKELGLIEEAVHLVNNRPTLHLRLDVLQLRDALQAEERDDHVVDEAPDATEASVGSAEVRSCTAYEEPPVAAPTLRPDDTVRHPLPPWEESDYGRLMAARAASRGVEVVYRPGEVAALPVCTEAPPNENPRHMERLLNRWARRTMAQELRAAAFAVPAQLEDGRAPTERCADPRPNDRSMRKATATSATKGCADGRPTERSTVDQTTSPLPAQRAADGRPNERLMVDHTRAETTSEITPETTAQTTAISGVVSGMLEGERGKERKGERGEDEHKPEVRCGNARATHHGDAERPADAPSGSMKRGHRALLCITPPRGISSQPFKDTGPRLRAPRQQNSGDTTPNSHSRLEAVTTGASAGQQVAL
jgi:hypothetical protein